MSDIDATQARQDVVAEVDEIIGHVINANMLNMPYHVYSELFDAVDGLGVEIENLQSENRKLRELVYSAHSCIDRFCGEYGCDGCPLLHDEMEPCDLGPILANMRKLGIEVDE